MCKKADELLVEETGKAFKKDKKVQKGKGLNIKHDFRNKKELTIDMISSKALNYIDDIILTGIAFPCCISVNNAICHYSPLTHDADTILKEGDLAKIDLGAHIDGFIAVVAHTGKLLFPILFL